MPDNQPLLLNGLPRTPWNKGKLIGPKPPTPAKARLVDQNPTNSRGPRP